MIVYARAKYEWHRPRAYICSTPNSIRKTFYSVLDNFYNPKVLLPGDKTKNATHHDAFWMDYGRNARLVSTAEIDISLIGLKCYLMACLATWLVTIYCSVGTFSNIYLLVTKILSQVERMARYGYWRGEWCSNIIWLWICNIPNSTKIIEVLLNSSTLHRCTVLHDFCSQLQRIIKM